jgi:hypothetical protein
MNNVVFQTSGDWDNTTLANNGQEVMAAQLFVDLKAGRDEFGDPVRGGVFDGGEMTAIIRAQADPEVPIGIFPGRLEMEFPGHSVQVENTHPTFAFEFTHIWYNGRDVTDKIVDLYVDINAVDNVVQAYITLYKAHWLGSDEVATFNII